MSSSSSPLPIFLMAVVLLLGVSPRPQTRRSRTTGRPMAVPFPDPNVSRQMKEFKTEVIKNRILSEVNLSEPPPMTAPVHLPQSVIDLLVSKDMDESILGEGENLIAYPLNDNASCGNETICSRFIFEIPSEGKLLSSVHLWVRKLTPFDSLDILACVNLSTETECEPYEKLSEVRADMGWAIFEIPTKFLLEFSADQLFCTVDIYGSMADEHEDEKPFLVGNTSPESADRKRRSAVSVSSNNCTCCLVDFYVSFKEIGWHWVVAPLGFSANMCYGKCNSQLNSYPSHYHRMISTILNNKTATAEKKEDIWTPCCSPTKLGPLNMIYVSGNNTNTNSSSSAHPMLIYHRISDMITESCGCW